MRRIAQVAADVRTTVLALDQALRGQPINGIKKPRVQSRIGRLEHSEIESLAAGRGGFPHDVGDLGGVAEAHLCLQCGCFAAESCDLRRLADEYVADPSRYRNAQRASVSRSPLSVAVVHEPGKCIRCGRCVRLAAEYQAPRGMAIIGRGAAMRIMPPFGESVHTALGETTENCVEACPTGALTYGCKRNER